MASMNRVFIMGYLGQQPEITISKSGKPYTRLNVATHRTWMNSDDQREQQTEWHSVFVWGQLAEQCCHSLHKGSLVFVEGALNYWKVNEKDYRNAIHGYRVTFINSRSEAKTFAPPERAPDKEDTVFMDSNTVEVDNPRGPRNHNAVAHPA